MCMFSMLCQFPNIFFVSLLSFQITVWLILVVPALCCLAGVIFVGRVVPL